MTEQNPSALVSLVSTEGRRHTVGHVGIVPNIEEVSSNGSVRVVGVSMDGRHLNDDKSRFNQIDELNLRLNKEQSRSRGVRFSQARHSQR